MKTISITKKQNQRTNYSALFLYLTILTVLFFFLEVSFLIRFSGFYLSDVKEIAGHLTFPLKAIPAIVFFVFVQLFIHFLFIVFVWGQAVLIGKVQKYSEKQTEMLGFTLWGLSLAAIIFSNQYYYPNSNFCALTKAFVSHSLAGDLSFILILILACVFVTACYALIKMVLGFTQVVIGLSVVAISCIVYFIYHHKPIIVNDSATQDKPNIILIGIDSLRPDFLGYFSDTEQTPHLDTFLNQSTVFAEALTPLARTFPAWTSILTGEYPKQNGVRVDLDDLGKVNLQATLSEMLRQQGYATFFATDETRFSNIDQRFGFDQILTPPIGLNDFLLGTLNDFPFSNLLVNTRVGEWLFPYSYANRPVFATYNPDSFLRLLEPTFKKSRTKPVFLAVHFCLPHFPYIYGTKPLNDKSIYNYHSAIQRIDQQFGDFIALLERNHLLEHAIVVVLSDHGEAIELRGDRATDPDLFISNKSKTIPSFYPPMLDNEKVNESAGHGTDVLGITQYHTVLAFQLFGLQQKNQTKLISGLVSLLDIRPTLLDMLGIPSQSLAGVSRKENIVGHQDVAIQQKDFFTESDFSPISIRTVHPETRNVLLEGTNYYKIDPKTMRVMVKNSMRKLIISSKQLADFSGDWVLALYPQHNKTMIPILVNLKSGKWTDDLSTHFAQKSPAQKMLVALREFYGDEVLVLK
jgi:arylsulfatase A-like enzyme